MQEIYVQSSSQLRNKINQLRNLNNKLKTEVSELVRLESRVNAMWDGQANDEFHNVFNQDKAMFDQFIELINTYIRALEEILRNYEAAETKNITVAKTRK